MSKNVPITFRWHREIKDFEWPEKTRKSVMAISFILLSFADPDGQNVFPSNGTIADESGLNIKTVRKILKLMIAEKFLRNVSKMPSGQYKRRLIYPALPVETYLQSPTISEKSSTTTNRTELPSADSSPDGDIVAPSATTQPVISIPKVEVDRRVLERKGLEFLRPFFERGERVSIPEPRTLAQKYYDDDLNDLWQSLTRTSVFSDMIRFMESLGWDDSPYDEMVSVLSGECQDKTQIKSVIKDIEDRADYSLSNAQCCLEDLYATWRGECEDGWINHEGDWNDAKFLSDLGWKGDFYGISNVIYSVEKLKRAIDDSRDRVMAIRAKAGSVSVSATNTGSDPIIVEKIVESVKTVSVTERW